MTRLFSLSEVEDTLRLLALDRPVLSQGDSFFLVQEAENIFSVVLSGHKREGGFSSEEIARRVVERLKQSGRLLRLAS